MDRHPYEMAWNGPECNWHDPEHGRCGLPMDDEVHWVRANPEITDKLVSMFEDALMYLARHNYTGNNAYIVLADPDRDPIGNSIDMHEMREFIDAYKENP